MNKCKKGEPGPHHWIIAESAGPSSFGECQNCHWTKMFENASPESHWASESQVAAAIDSAKAKRQTRATKQREEALVFGEEN